MVWNGTGASEPRYGTVQGQVSQGLGRLPKIRVGSFPGLSFDLSTCATPTSLLSGNSAML